MIPKIAIIGPESTGKSTIAQQLAHHFQTKWVDEYAREYIDHLKRPYVQSDLHKIAAGQLQNEADKHPQASKVLICDTNLLVIKVWSEYKYGHCDSVILDQMKLSSYAHHFLTDIDIPWTFDPQREHPDKREELFKIYQSELERENLAYTILCGTPSERLKEAIAKINQIILAK